MNNLVTMILRESIRTENLRSLIRQKKGRAFNLPLYLYQPIFDSPTAINYLKNPSSFHWTFFTSPNSVKSLKQIAVRNKLPLPVNAKCAAPGQGSYKLLYESGFHHVFSPRGISDINTLLNFKIIGNLRNKRIAVMQRENATEKTFLAIKAKHAIPTSIYCYTRTANADDVWQKLDKDLQKDINSIIAFDTPSLTKLIEISGADSVKIKDIPLAVIHQNIALKAQELGFKTIIVSGEQNDMINKLIKTLNIGSA